jgi:hypothetical protein
VTAPPEEIIMWSNLWYEARRNMPKRHPSFMGSSVLLRELLGYSSVTKTGGKVGNRVSCEQHVKTAIERGDKPRDPQRQRLLKMLAGPHGKTVIRAIAIQRGIDLSKYKVWPK